MTSNTPVIGQTSFLGAIPLVTTMVFSAVIGLWLIPDQGDLIGMTVFIPLWLGLRRIAWDHRSGIAKVRRNLFAEAIPSFERSLEFFDRHPWLDRYRSVFLLSPSAISYREMAMTNIGFCYSQLLDGANARVWYTRCIERFPKSGIAQCSLNMLDSAITTTDIPGNR